MYKRQVWAGWRNMEKGLVEESVPLAYASGFSYLDVEGNDVEMIRKLSLIHI